jgi:hypothetical protein
MGEKSNVTSAGCQFVAVFNSSIFGVTVSNHGNATAEGKVKS